MKTVTSHCVAVAVVCDSWGSCRHCERKRQPGKLVSWDLLFCQWFPLSMVSRTFLQLPKKGILAIDETLICVGASEQSASNTLTARLGASEAVPSPPGGFWGISPLIQNSIIFHQISECKAPLNKSKAPLLKTFWRRFWSEAIITCTVLKFWRSDIHIFRGVVERECVGTAFPDLSRVLLWNEYEAVLKWLVFWVLSHTSFVSTTSLHILTSKDKYR